MISRFVAVLLLTFTLGATLSACGDAPDMDDAEVEVDDD
jgi:hypothetical protein